jgi:hypothetical protein
MTVAGQAGFGFFIDTAYGRASIDLFASKVVPELAS